ncbi:hypothetical protein Hanom_Chr16g01513291 [Helianthus anomalus]
MLFSVILIHKSFSSKRSKRLESVLVILYQELDGNISMKSCTLSNIPCPYSN